VSKILQDSWGYHKGVHGGVDLICPPNAPIFAICKAKVIDVREEGWWGNPTPTPEHPASDGDGIIQLECLADNGPLKKGLHFGYGHSEHHSVNVGDIVEAGQPIGKAGYANAWHVHFMVNDGTTMDGVGDRDPKPFVDYARKYS
jgi:murein DD-endopeptidase MepM/ murein hydrolase activator NlpD